MKDFFVSIWIIIIIVVMVVGGGAAAGVIVLTRGPAAGSLPTLSTGNQWVYEFSMKIDGTYTGTLTQKVTGEETIDGVDCYIVEWTFEPAMTGTEMGVTWTVSSMKEWVEKNTTFDKKMETYITSDGMTLKSLEEYSYVIEGTMWPLEVGKEITMTTTTTSTTYMDETIVKGPTTTTETYAMKVEAKEDVTIAAGTFNCFRMVSYYESGEKQVEMWYADKAKTQVKYVAYAEDGTTTMSMELESYSV